MRYFLIVLLLLSACATTSDEQFAWNMVKKEYPDCNKEKPKVVWIDFSTSYKGIERNAWYCENRNTIYINRNSDMRTLAMEYANACGDHRGHDYFIMR